MSKNISIVHAVRNRNGNGYKFHIRCYNDRQVTMITNVLREMFNHVTLKSSNRNGHIKIFNVRDKLPDQMGGTVYFRSGSQTDTSIYIIAHFDPQSVSFETINGCRSLISTQSRELPHLTLFDLHTNHKLIRDDPYWYLVNMMPGIADMSCQFKNKIGDLQPKSEKFNIIGENPYVVIDYNSTTPTLNNDYQEYKDSILNYCGKMLYAIPNALLHNFNPSVNNPSFLVFDRLGLGPELMASAIYYQNLLRFHVSLSSLNQLKPNINPDIKHIRQTLDRMFVGTIHMIDLKYIEISIVNLRASINYHYVLNCKTSKGVFYIKDYNDNLYLSPNEVYI